MILHETLYHNHAHDENTLSATVGDQHCWHSKMMGCFEELLRLWAFILISWAGEGKKELWMNRQDDYDMFSYIACAYVQIIHALLYFLSHFENRNCFCLDWNFTSVLKVRALCFALQMMLLALIPSVFLLLPKRYVHEVYKMDSKTLGVICYLLLRCIILTRNIGLGTPFPFPIYPHAAF